MLLLCFSLFLLLNTAFARYFRQSTLLLLDKELYYSTSVTRVQITGVMNGPLKFLTARKILPLLDLLAKFKRVLACSCSPNFCVARKLAKQFFYFCSCSQKIAVLGMLTNARKDHSSPPITLQTSTNTGTSRYSQLSHKLPPLVHYKEVAYRRLSCMGKITKQAQLELITINFTQSYYLKS